MGVATDLSGKVIWYYTTYPAPAPYILITRPLKNGGMLSIQNGVAWNPTSQVMQILRQTDLAGNVVRETNTGAIQQGLIALGAKGLGPCNVFPQPAPVGSSCLGAFHHDAIQTLPDDSLAVLVDNELTWQQEKTGFKRVLVPPTPEKLKVIHDLVAGITGFSSERGDQLLVEILLIAEIALLAREPSAVQRVTAVGLHPRHRARNPSLQEESTEIRTGGPDQNNSGISRYRTTDLYSE